MAWRGVAWRGVVGWVARWARGSLTGWASVLTCVSFPPLGLRPGSRHTRAPMSFPAPPPPAPAAPARVTDIVDNALLAAAGGALDEDGKGNQGADMAQRRLAAWVFLHERTEHLGEAKELVRKGVLSLVESTLEAPGSSPELTVRAWRVYSGLTRHEEGGATPFGDAILPHREFLGTAVQAVRSAVPSTVLLAALQGVVRILRVSPADHAAHFARVLGGLPPLVALADGGQDTEAKSNIEGAVAAILNVVVTSLEEATSTEQLVASVFVPLADLAAARGADVDRILALVAAVGHVAHHPGVIDALAKHPKCVSALVDLMRAGGPRTQTRILAVCQSFSGYEQGRALLEPFVPGLHHLMLHSTTPAVQSQAAVTVAKLEAIKKKTGFDPGEDAGELVLAQTLRLVTDAATAAKGVEALTFMMSSTRVKEAVCDQAGVLDALVAADLSQGAGLYGLCCVWRDLTMSNMDKKRDKLREMEVSAEQWQEFERMTSVGGEADAKKLEEDTPEMVARRIEIVRAHQGVVAMVNVGNALGEHRAATGHKELAQALCNTVATNMEARAQLVQAGGLTCLLRLHDGDEDATKGLAGQALARVLITTNPSLLPLHTVTGCVAPLLWGVERSKDDLKEFESLMALTNLLSLNEPSIMDRVAKKAKSVEYCMFSDHPLVRRAATEAMCNMVGHEDVVTFLTANKSGERVRLWLALAQDEQEAFETARAAAGGLAMMVADPRLAKLVLQEKGMFIMAKILQSTTSEEMRVRAMHCLQTLKEFRE